MQDASDLAFFALLARSASLAAAAAELGVTPPAVSRRLAALEARLGVRLLNRTTRRQSLTPEGELYLQHARRILADLNDMEREVSGSRGTPLGLLRVNATLGFGHAGGPDQDRCELQTGNPGVDRIRRHHMRPSVQVNLGATALFRASSPRTKLR